MSSPLSSVATRARATTTRQRLVAVLVIAVAGTGLGIGLSSAKSTTPRAAGVTTTTTTTAPPATKQPPRPRSDVLAAFDHFHCPLTDLPDPAGVPDRPALAVKVGNEPFGARPQSGLNEADVVFDTPAEGFIMRYIAVFQCRDASAIGPTRSVRWVDYHLVRQLLNPILAFAGGVDHNVNIVMHLTWAKGANLLQAAGGAGVRISSRVPPDNLFTSTAGLYGLYKSDVTPPRPIFTYSSTPSADATPAAAVGINFSYDTDVVWRWDASRAAWLHFYGGSPDIDTLTGHQVAATNVVVQVVTYKFGKYIESFGGTGDFESQTLGSGPAYVLRGGTVTKATWHRDSLVDPTTYTDASGAKVALAPGNTWVELLPNTTAAAAGALTITP